MLGSIVATDFSPNATPECRRSIVEFRWQRRWGAAISVVNRFIPLDRIEHLATELDRGPPWHDDLLIISARDSSAAPARSPGQTTLHPQLLCSRDKLPAERDQ